MSESLKICSHGKHNGDCSLCRAWCPAARAMSPGRHATEVAGLKIVQQGGPLKHGDCGLAVSRSAEVFLESDIAAEITGSVLDVGCGTGVVGIWLARRGCYVMMIDKYSWTTQATYENAHDNGVKSSMIVEDWASPYKAIDQHDNVIAIDPIENINELILFMRSRWNGKGRLIICDPGRHRDPFLLPVSITLEHGDFATKVWAE